MSKQEFIEKATECGYDEETIRKFVEVVSENDDIKYEDIYLTRIIVD